MQLCYFIQHNIYVFLLLISSLYSWPRFWVSFSVKLPCTEITHLHRGCGNLEWQSNGGFRDLYTHPD